MDRPESGDVTKLLADWSHGDENALERLAPLVYDELHRLAARHMRGERADHTLQSTALVNEAFVRLFDQRRVQWHDTVHFLALAAQMMRRILVDHARGKRYAKRGGESRRVSLEDAPEIAQSDQPYLIALNDALTEMAGFDRELSKIVELRFFGGLKSEEIAAVLGVSVPTVTRRWSVAKAWLYRYLTGDGADGH
jgi:RNA polymerase sigma factor (TIGR02999 family)